MGGPASGGEAPESRVALGKLGRPHGVRGEMRVDVYNPGSELLTSLETCFLGDDPAPRRIAGFRGGAGGRLLVTLEGVDDRDAAAALTGRELTVPRSWLPEPEDGVYLTDLVGLSVVDREGAALGRVRATVEAGGQDLLEIDDGGRVWLLPAVDAFLVEVDLEGGRLVVAVPEGLRDLEEPAR